VISLQVVECEAEALSRKPGEDTPAPPSAFESIVASILGGDEFTDAGAVARVGSGVGGVDASTSSVGAMSAAALPYHRKTFRLSLLQSMTPEELFARKVEAREYGRAAVLAKRFNLCSDPVHIQQWESSADPSEHAVRNHLRKVTDDRCVRVYVCA
jgi:hypothetical protein